MNRTLSAFLATGFIFAGWAGYAMLYRAKPEAPWQIPVTHLPFDSNTIDLQIRNRETGVEGDPYGALGWSMLCSAYMVRSRESDDLLTAQKAEAAARRSLSLRKLGNVGAWNKLIGSLLQEHRFKDALRECEIAEAGKINDDDTTQHHVECLVEVGRYDEAGVLVSKHPRAFSDASGKTIVARLLDVGGKPEQAISLLKNATIEVDQNGGMPSDAIAWFHTRLGIQLAKVGRHSEGEKEFKSALALYPRDYKAMAGLARLAFQEGHWGDAIAWGNRSDEIAQMADVRALVGDAYALNGDATKAEEQYGRVAALVGRPSGLMDGLHEVTPGAGTHGHRLDRQYAIFCADHNRDLEGAYAAALRDFDARHDIYAYDTLAWVCLKRGNKDEAAKAMVKALEHGTRDPMLCYHAAVIAEANGDWLEAYNNYRDALSIDPHFDGVFAPKALAAANAMGRSLAQNASTLASVHLSN